MRTHGNVGRREERVPAAQLTPAWTLTRIIGLASIFRARVERIDTLRSHRLVPVAPFIEALKP